MYLSTCVFISLKTSSLHILMGSLGFFFNLFMPLFLRSKFQVFQDRCLSYLRTIRYAYIAPCDAMQQLRSQTQSGSSAPQLDMVQLGPQPLAWLPRSWSKARYLVLPKFPLPLAPLHSVELPCDIYPWFLEVQDTIIAIWSHRGNWISVLWKKNLKWVIAFENTLYCHIG